MTEQEIEELKNRYTPWISINDRIDMLKSIIDIAKKWDTFHVEKEVVDHLYRAAKLLSKKINEDISKKTYIEGIDIEHQKR